MEKSLNDIYDGPIPRKMPKKIKAEPISRKMPKKIKAVNIHPESKGLASKLQRVSSTKLGPIWDCCTAFYRQKSGFHSGFPANYLILPHSRHVEKVATTPGEHHL